MPRLGERRAALEGACVYRGKSGHVGPGERWRAKSERGNEGGGGVWGVCLQDCVMHAGSSVPVVINTERHSPQKKVGRAVLSDKLLL